MKILKRLHGFIGGFAAIIFFIPITVFFGKEKCEKFINYFLKFTDI